MMPDKKPNNYTKPNRKLNNQNGARQETRQLN